MDKPDTKKLTGKMKKWADAYLVTLNKTEAARRAGYKGNDVTLGSIGYQNFKKLQVQEYLKQQFDQMAMSAEEALARLADIARASHADFVGVNIRDDLEGHPMAHVVKTVVTDTYEDAKGKIHHKMKLELHPALAALEDILKIHGKFKETVTNLNYDLSKATDEQLQRIAAGDDPATVLQQNPTTSGG